MTVVERGGKIRHGNRPAPAARVQEVGLAGFRQATRQQLADPQCRSFRAVMSAVLSGRTGGFLSHCRELALHQRH